MFILIISIQNQKSIALIFTLHIYSYQFISFSVVGGIVLETVRSRVSENLWNLLTLARVRAIARLSQYETARNDAIMLLPLIFKTESTQNSTGRIFSVDDDFYVFTLI